jgi:hypothetical protein
VSEGSYAVSSVAMLVQHLFGLNSIIITLQKRKQSESDARTSTITKKRHYRNATSHESENKLHTPRKEGTTLSHSAHSGWLQKADMHASQTPRTLEGTVVCAYP